MAEHAHSTPTPSVSRRQLTTGAAALFSLAGARATSRAAPGADAELIQACAEFDLVERAIQSAGGHAEPGSDEEFTMNAQFGRLSDLLQEILPRICAAPCTTAAGLQALTATVALHMRQLNFDDFPNGYTDERLMFALVRGLMGDRIGQVLAPSTPGAANRRIPMPPPPPGPDAKLMALCAEYVALDRRYVAKSYEVNDMLPSDPAFKVLDREIMDMVPDLHRMEAEITAMRAITMEGIRAKARATRHAMAGNADKDTGPMDEESYLAWSLLGDLLAGWDEIDRRQLSPSFS